MNYSSTTTYNITESHLWLNMHRYFKKSTDFSFKSCFSFGTTPFSLRRLMEPFSLFRPHWSKHGGRGRRRFGPGSRRKLHGKTGRKASETWQRSRWLGESHGLRGGEGNLQLWLRNGECSGLTLAGRHAATAGHTVGTSSSSSSSSNLVKCATSYVRRLISNVSCLARSQDDKMSLAVVCNCSVNDEFGG